MYERAPFYDYEGWKSLKSMISGGADTSQEAYNQYVSDWQKDNPNKSLPDTGYIDQYRNDNGSLNIDLLHANPEDNKKFNDQISQNLTDPVGLGDLSGIKVPVSPWDLAGFQPPDWVEDPTDPWRYINPDTGERRSDEEIAISDINKNFGIGDPVKDAQLQSTYDQIEKNVIDNYSPELNRQFSNYLRQLKFNLARNGLSGGSVDVDKNAEAQRKYDDALVNIKAKGTSARDQAELGDEGIRLDTINSINSGGDRNLAWESAINRMQSSNNDAYASNTANSIGDVFGDAARAVPVIAHYNGYQSPYYQNETPIYFGSSRGGSGNGYKGSNS